VWSVRDNQKSSSVVAANLHWSTLAQLARTVGASSQSDDLLQSLSAGKQFCLADPICVAYAVDLTEESIVSR
jgi:hypothetical protein